MLDGYSIVNFESPVKAKSEYRSCGNCTHCCEGWLTCTVFGNDIKLDNPCHFLKKNEGCQVYSIRQYNPCKTFYCYYVQNKNVPEQFKPCDSKNIMIYRKSSEGYMHLDLVPAGKPISIELLNWAIMHYNKKEVDSVRWFDGPNIYYVSRDPRFIEAMEV